MLFKQANLFEVFDSRLDDLNLIQLVNFDTWSRMVGLVVRSSIRDHIYVNRVGLIHNLKHLTPVFGDHVLILADVCMARPVSKTIIRRDWRRYSKEKLIEQLRAEDWSNDANNVQEIWNDFEIKLVNIQFSQLQFISA